MEEKKENKNIIIDLEKPLNFMEMDKKELIKHYLKQQTKIDKLAEIYEKMNSQMKNEIKILNDIEAALKTKLPKVN